MFWAHTRSVAPTAETHLVNKEGRFFREAMARGRPVGSHLAVLGERHSLRGWGTEGTYLGGESTRVAGPATVAEGVDSCASRHAGQGGHFLPCEGPEDQPWQQGTEAKAQVESAPASWPGRGLRPLFSAGVEAGRPPSLPCSSGLCRLGSRGQPPSVQHEAIPTRLL